MLDLFQHKFTYTARLKFPFPRPLAGEGEGEGPDLGKALILAFSQREKEQI